MLLNMIFKGLELMAIIELDEHRWADEVIDDVVLY